MVNQYFLMRHGESLANLADLIISSPQSGCSGYGLSEEGRLQARRSAAQSGLASRTLIVASDFLRARETASIAAQVLGCPEVVPESGLRERFFGDLEGTSATNYHSVWERDVVRPDDSSQGVETPQALVERLGRVIQRLEAEYSNECILLVSHGDPLRFLQLWAAGRPLTEHLQLPLFAPAEIRALDFAAGRAASILNQPR